MFQFNSTMSKKVFKGIETSLIMVEAALMLDIALLTFGHKRLSLHYFTADSSYRTTYWKTKSQKINIEKLI